MDDQALGLGFEHWFIFLDVGRIDIQLARGLKLGIP
jgi:hypothetical protein